MITLRRLTPAGLDLFWGHIEGCKDDKRRLTPVRQLPTSLLEGAHLTQILPSEEISIDQNLRFATRFEFAKYVAAQIGGNWHEEFSDDVGLWAWIAVAYWDQFTAMGVRRPEHYIPLIGTWSGKLGHQRLDYRHCARAPVLLYRKLGEAAKLILAGPSKTPRPMAEMGDFVEQILSRQDVYGSAKYLEVLQTLYADANGFEKVGSTAKPKKKKLANGKWSASGRGGARRLIMGVLPRLKLTYNVNEVGADTIVQLAGGEFEDFKRKVA